MLNKTHAIFALFLFVGIFWSPMCLLVKAQGEELRRPTRPDIFNSPEEVAQYVKDLHEYVRAKGIRYGKRFAPRPNDEAGDEDLHASEIINEFNKHHLKTGENRPSIISDAIDEENPREQLVHEQMRPLKVTNLYRLLTQIPLPLLAKYLHINQIINQSDQEQGFNTNHRRTMLHPFVRQRFLSTQPKDDGF